MELVGPGVGLRVCNETVVRMKDIESWIRVAMMDLNMCSDGLE